MTKTSLTLPDSVDISYISESRYFLYVVACEDSDFIKIGITYDLRKRVGSMQTGCPLKINIAFAVAFSNKSTAEHIESRIHKALKQWSIRGEWFSYDCGDKLSELITKLECKPVSGYDVLILYSMCKIGFKSKPVRVDSKLEEFDYLKATKCKRCWGIIKWVKNVATGKYAPFNLDKTHHKCKNKKVGLFSDYMKTSKTNYT